jgi:hypothetical protein
MAILQVVRGYRHGSKNAVPRWAKAALIVGALLLLAGGTVLAKKLAPEPVIPSSIQKAVASTIFIPGPSATFINRKTVKYDSKTKLLSYQATAFGINTIISEQPTPDSFTDIPQVYDKFIDNLNQYSNFDTNNGKVFLTHPKELKGGQTAVMNSKGTLMFAKPDRALSGDQWRQFFKSLKTL